MGNKISIKLAHPLLLNFSTSLKRCRCVAWVRKKRWSGNNKFLTDISG